MKTAELFDKEASRIWATIDEKDESLLTRPIRDDGWTALDILKHIVTATKGLLSLAQHQYKHGPIEPVSGRSGSPDFDLDTWNEAQVAKWHERPLNDLRTEWETTALRMHGFLNELSEADLGRPVRFATGSDMTLGELLNTMTYHMRTHRQELERGMAGEMVTPTEH